MSSFSATAAVPYEHLERATAGISAELRRQILAADVQAIPRWETLTVSGSRKFTDLYGRIWYEYRATVESRPSFGSMTTGTPPGHLPVKSG